MAGYGPENTPLKRFDVKHLKSDILQILNLEKGILYTIFNLTIRPGEALRTYLFEDRTKMVKPFPFLLLIVAVASFLTVNFINYEEIMVQGQGGWEMNADPKFKELMDQVNHMIAQSYNVIQLISVPFLAIASYVFFYRHKYNFAEHLVIAAFLTAIVNAFYVIIFPLFIKYYMNMSSIFLIVMFVYFTFVYRQVFKEPIGKTIIKGIGVQILYFAALMIVLFVFVVGYTAYLTVKMKGG